MQACPLESGLLRWRRSHASLTFTLALVKFTLSHNANANASAILLFLALTFAFSFARVNKVCRRVARRDSGNKTNVSFLSRKFCASASKLTQRRKFCQESACCHHREVLQCSGFFERDHLPTVLLLFYWKHKVVQLQIQFKIGLTYL